MKLKYRNLVLLYFICFWMLPNYFGVKFSGMPLITVQRALLIFLLFWTFCSKGKLNQTIFEFRNCCYTERYFLLMFFLSACITGARNGMNSFFNPLFDYIIPYIIFFTAYHCFYSFRDLCKVMNGMLVILCLFGIVEFLFHVNVFDYLNTGMTDLNYGSLTRGNDLRICTAFGHPLAYSMILNMALPLMCYNIKLNKIDFLYKKWTILLIAVNILLTGSRSGIAVFIVESLLIILLTDKNLAGRTYLYLFMAGVMAIAVILIANRNPIVQNILRSILYVVDELLGTKYALRYGGSSSITQSSQYRKILWELLSYKDLFTYFGHGNEYKISIRIGTWFVESIDNYYINQYLKYGLIGVIIIVSLMLQYIYRLLKNAICCNMSKKLLCYLFLISAVGYLCSLLVADEIGTMRIMFSIMAIAEVYCFNRKDGFSA